MGGHFREMLDTVVRIHFRGSNFLGTLLHVVVVDDVIMYKYKWFDAEVSTTLRFTSVRLGRPGLEKNQHANGRMATMLIHWMWRELLASFFIAYIQFYFIDHNDGQPVIEDPVD